jgi:ankyrin repeat protein
MALKFKTLNCWLLLLLSVAGIAAAGSDLRLADAVKNKDKEAVRSLLKQHVDVNTPSGDGTTALVWAAHWDELETADLLIRAGANVNTANDYDITPLWEACNNGSGAMVETLLEARANPNAALPKTGETMLMRCARTGNTDAVKTLLAHGAEVNAKELQKGQTALMWAIEQRHPEVAQALIAAGADCQAKSKGGLTPSLFAARQGDIETAKLLLEKGADVNEAAPGGLSVLLLAIDSGHEDFAKWLVEKGASVNAADPNGLTALHYSLRKGISILQFVNYLTGNYQPSFAYLFRPNMQQLVNVLLEHGANPNARILKGTKLGSQLAGSDWPYLGLAGVAPFMLAAASGDVSTMRTLLAKGANPKLGSNDGVTPLMAAAGVGQASQYVLTEAEEKQNLQAVKFLVELGADVNAANDEGYTALHGAAFTGGNEIIQYLVDKGARLDAEDVYGQTPLSIAEGDPNLMMGFNERAFHPGTAELLRKLGGDIQAHFDETLLPKAPVK